MSFQWSDPGVDAKIAGIAAGGTLRLARKECIAKGCFEIKKNILGRNQRFSAAVLSQMINSDVDAKRVYIFVKITAKYVIKYTDKLPSVRHVHCEIVIV